MVEIQMEKTVFGLWGRQNWHVNVLLMGFSSEVVQESYVEITWDHRNVCVKAEILAYVSAGYCKLAMWHTVLAAVSGSAHRADVLRATPLLFPRKSWSSVWPRVSRVLYKMQHRALTDPLPLISNHLAWLVPEAGSRLDEPMVCPATQFLYSCVTLLFLFYLFRVCLLCSLVELEKEVNNIKTGLKAVEAVSIWRSPKCHT